MDELTPEQNRRVAESLAAVMAITESLAEIMPTVLAIRATLRCALFLTERYMTDNLSPKDQYCDAELKKMIIKELGFVN